MAKIKILNFGPIREGCDSNDGFINIEKVTILIGDNGTGKSTIAKLISTCLWLEKALVRGDFKEKYLEGYNRFKKTYLAYQGIGDYLNAYSMIDFRGEAFRIFYKNETLTVKRIKSTENYKFPKVMYVPAERNFITSVGRPDLVKRLPNPLYEFLDEYFNAIENMKEDIMLPIGKGNVSIRRKGKKMMIIGENFELPLINASSGHHSIIPLFLVTNYLIELIQGRVNQSQKTLNLSEGHEIRKKVLDIISNRKLSEDIKRIALESLSGKLRYDSLINIVEEPEQNLYPLSQGKLLWELLSFNNKIGSNRLLITTHSPYIINYLTLAVKAHQIYIKESDLNFKLPIPREASIEGNHVKIYQLLDGRVTLLPNYHQLPSDDNFLNEQLDEFNRLFSDMLEVELG